MPPLPCARPGCAEGDADVSPRDTDSGLDDEFGYLLLGFVPPQASAAEGGETRRRFGSGTGSVVGFGSGASAGASGASKGSSTVTTRLVSPMRMPRGYLVMDFASYLNGFVSSIGTDRFEVGDELPQDAGDVQLRRSPLGRTVAYSASITLPRVLLRRAP